MKFNFTIGFFKSLSIACPLLKIHSKKKKGLFFFPNSFGKTWSKYRAKRAKMIIFKNSNPKKVAK